MDKEKDLCTRTFSKKNIYPDIPPTGIKTCTIVINVVDKKSPWWISKRLDNLALSLVYHVIVEVLQGKSYGDEWCMQDFCLTGLNVWD